MQGLMQQKEASFQDAAAKQCTDRGPFFLILCHVPAQLYGRVHVCL